MKMKKESIDKTPEISCACLINFPENIEVSPIIDSLKQIGITKMKINKPRYDSAVSISISICDDGYKSFWYLEDALTEMFSHIDSCLFDLCKIIKKFHGEVIIDIAFYQYGTYPALEFCGENMRKIRYLEADISIDAYDMKL